MERKKKSKNFLPKPHYPGGSRALQQFIRETLTYPPKALEAQIQGVVRIKAAIDYRGTVIDTQVLVKLGYGCDEEAERIVRLMQWQIDKKMQQGKILFHKTLNITFRLAEQPLTLSQSQRTQQQDSDHQAYTYNIIPTTVEPSTKPKPLTIRYTYHIQG